MSTGVPTQLEYYRNMGDRSGCKRTVTGAGDRYAA